MRHRFLLSSLLARGLTILAALCVGLPGFAQSDAAPAQLPVGTQLVQRRWGAEDGLPHAGVWAVRQTRDGYLWVGTQGGLARFDGVSFAAVPALAGAVVTVLTEDADGTLWVGTDGRGLYRYRAGHVTAVGAAEGLPSATAFAVLRDRAGRLWVGTDGGLFRAHADDRFAPVVLPPALGGGAVVMALAEDAAGWLWVGTAGSGLVRLRGDSARHLSVADGLSSDNVRALIGDPSGGVWAATWGGGVNRIASNGAVTVYRDGSALDANRFRTLYRDRAGVVWGGRQSGLARLLDGRIVAAGGVTARTTALTEDREGNLWAGLYNGGLARLTPDPFRSVTVQGGLRSDNVRTVLAEPDGTRWIGTKGGGLSQVRGGQTTTLTTADGLLSDNVWSLHRDAGGTLWVGTDYGVNRLNAERDGRPRFTGFRDPRLATAIVQALHRDADGTLWVGTEGAGLLRFRDGAYAPAPDARLASSNVRTLLPEAGGPGAGGALWVATDDQGLFRVGAGGVRHFTTRDGLGTNRLRGLYHDAAGGLWIGSDGGGVTRYARGRFAAISIAQGLADNQVWDVRGDGRGRLWMSSNRGVFFADRAALDAVAEGRARTVTSAWYGRPLECNGSSQPSSQQASDGTLLFASMEGLVTVDPTHAATTQPRPPLHVDAVATGGVRQPVVDGEVRLPARGRTFQVAYAAPALRAPEQVRFRYRLEGVDPGWEEAGARRTAYYTRVPPGRHTFRVEAYSADGTWEPVAASLPITVAPYAYETWWFATAGALGGLLFLGAGHRARTRVLRRREVALTREVRLRTAEVVQAKERTEAALAETEAARLVIAGQADELRALDEAKSRFFTNISHEFRTPLTLILGPLEELLGGRHGELAGGAREQHTLMQRNGRRLLRLINQLLDLSKLEHGSLVLDVRAHDLGAFARDLVRACAPLAERRRVALTFEGDRPCVAAFDAEHFEKVGLNLLANALKFTGPGGAVAVVVRREPGGGASFAVRDTGAGIAPDQLARVFDRFYQADGGAARGRGGTGVGLALAREIAELHGGTIAVESVLGAGTTFTVRLPAADAAESGEGPAADPPAEARDAAALDPALGAGGLDDFGADDADLETPARPRADAAFRDRTTVLVVDDNPDVRTYVRSVLETGYRVLEAADGAEGLERARGALPDLIVADVMMPRMDGLALGRALKADPATDCIPLVLLTARAAEQDEVAGLRTGADDYVAKPFSAAVLRARVDGLIASRRRLQERFRANPAEAAPPEADTPETAEAPGAEVERRLRAAVGQHLADGDFNPEALARAAGLSYKQLYRTLHDVLDTTPSRFIRTVRVEHAARLLRAGAGSVTEVAYGVGFNSLSYFNRAFRERYGEAPSEHLRAPA